MLKPFKKILVLGDKGWTNDQLIRNFFDCIPDKSVILTRHGSLSTLAYKHTKRRGLRNISFIPQWNRKDGNCPGAVCNYEIINEGKPELVVIFTNFIEYKNGISHLEFLARKAHKSILYITEYTKTNYLYRCGNCSKITSSIDTTKPIKKFCSEECTLHDKAIILDMLKELKLNDEVDDNSHGIPAKGTYLFIQKINKTQEMMKSCREAIEANRPSIRILHSESKKDKKMIESAIKRADRLNYATKVESFKREMSKRSFVDKELENLRKERSNSSKSKSLICQAETKKGKKCKNKAIAGTKYCGIASHKK